MNLRLKSLETSAEAEELVDVLVTATHETLNTLDDTTEREEAERAARAWLGRFGEPGARAIVGEDEGRTLALAATAPFTDPLTADVVPMLVVLWVDPTIRHRGVARALVAELRRLLGAQGFGVLAARASTNDDALLSMGERWGLVRSWEFLSSE